MIRALLRAAGTVIFSVFVAATLLVAAFVAAVTIMLFGCYLALWPPKPQSTSLAVATRLIRRRRA